MTSKKTVDALVLACAPLALCVCAAAAADDAPPEHQWFGAGQAGLLASSGNTNSTSFNAKLDLARVDGPWKNVAYLGGLYGKNNRILSNERIEGRYELDRKVTDGYYWFGRLEGIRDLFSGFNYQETVSGGVGYDFIATETTKLSGTLGAGYQRVQTQQLVKDTSGAVIQRINGPVEGNVVGTAGLDFARKLGRTTQLTDKLLVTSGSQNTSIANDLALAVSMSDRLALSIGYGIRHNSDPAPGVKKLDQVTTANIVYKIK